MGGGGGGGVCKNAVSRVYRIVNWKMTIWEKMFFKRQVALPKSDEK